VLKKLTTRVHIRKTLQTIDEHLFERVYRMLSIPLRMNLPNYS
jgi:hypothetical protein